MSKKASFLVLALILSSCNTTGIRIESPSPKDVLGRWETTIGINPLFYGLLEFREDGSGTVFSVSDDGALPTMNLLNFVTKDFTFLITLELIEGDSTESEFGVFEGRIDDEGLCFELVEPEKDAEEFPPICFVRLGEVEKLRAKAIEAADVYSHR